MPAFCGGWMAGSIWAKAVTFIWRTATLRSVEAGEQKAFVWENGAFPPCSVQAEETGY